MLVHYPIDDICLPIFENIYILIIVFILFIYVFLFFILFFLKYIYFWRTRLETSVLLCGLMCLYPR